jgi:hypothetical protein
VLPCGPTGSRGPTGPTGDRRTGRRRRVAAAHGAAEPVVVRPGVPALVRPPGAGPRTPAVGHPAGRRRARPALGPHAGGARALPDGRVRPRKRAGRPLSRHLLGDQRPPVLGGHPWPSRRGLRQPGRVAAGRGARGSVRPRPALPVVPDARRRAAARRRPRAGVDRPYPLAGPARAPQPGRGAGRRTAGGRRAGHCTRLGWAARGTCATSTPPGPCAARTCWPWTTSCWVPPVSRTWPGGRRTTWRSPPASGAASAFPGSRSGFHSPSPQRCRVQ